MTTQQFATIKKALKKDMAEQRKAIGGVDPSRSHRVALDLVKKALPGKPEALHQDLAHAVFMSAR